VRGEEDVRFDERAGRRLRFLRRSLGITQGDLARACGIGFQLINKYESGERRISAARMWQLAEALQVPVAYFFETAGAEPRSFGADAERWTAAHRRDAAEFIDAYAALPAEPRQRLLQLAAMLASAELNA